MSLPMTNLIKKKGGPVFVAILLFGISAAFILQSSQFTDPNRTAQKEDASGWPTKRQLRRKLYEIRKELLVYGTGNEQAAAYQRFAENLASRVRGIDMIVKADSAVTEEELRSLPVWLVGTPSANSILKKIQGGLPVRPGDNGFVVAHYTFSDQSDIYTLGFYPNPLNRSLPIMVTSGNSDASILSHLQDRNHWGLFPGDLQVMRDGLGVAYGFFRQSESGPWVLNAENFRNYRECNNSALETPHYIFIYHGEAAPVEEIRKFARQQEKRFQKLAQALSFVDFASKPFRKIEYHLYPSLEDKGLMTRNTDLSHFDLEKWQVHAVFNDDLRGDDFFADAKLLFFKYVGKSKSSALNDGVGMYFSSHWGKRGYQFWTRLFYQTGNTGSLEDLLDSNIYRRESYLIMQPLAGSLVDFLVSQYGWRKFLSLYKTWPGSGFPQSPLPGFSPGNLQEGWLQHLASLDAGRETVVRADPAIEFQKGFCFAHEGYQIYNGYLSQQALQSLQKLRALGTSWISVTPFGYLGDAGKPGYFRYSFGPGSENDESLIRAVLSAKKLGMGVMLKPHVLLHGPHWGWPGDIEMRSEKDWAAFFNYYYKWMRHYAVLAEMYDMDILCIGVELMQTTKGHAKEWREMIKRIRQIYHGALVYGANWWKEFDQITFWNDLDYIGLNCYYPLSKKEKVTLADLKKGVSEFAPKIARVADKYKKPVLFTEVGFTSSAKGWQNPHERERRAAVDLEDQALAYQAVFETFWNKPWFYGFYWWKWPTFLGYGGERHNGFTPNGKPAEKVVQAWYGRKGPRRRPFVLQNAHGPSGAADNTEN
ncbi:MAG: hypothetical protein ACE5HO_20070 [bacterium]